MISAGSERDPLNYGEAMRSDKLDGWEKAVELEISVLQENDVWTVVKRAPKTYVLHTKWVYNTKTDARGELERLKARLVACGNEQVPGVDYTLTFAAVMDLSSVKVILKNIFLCGFYIISTSNSLLHYVYLHFFYFDLQIVTVTFPIRFFSLS